MMAGSVAPETECLFLLVSYLSVETEDIFRNKYSFQLISFILSTPPILIQMEKYC